MTLKIKYLVLPAVVALLLGLYLKLGIGGDVKGAEARRLVAKGARLIDVRSPEEFGGGHIAGAVNIPVGTLGDRLGEIGPKDTPVVVYCKSGLRSSRAATLLRRQGFAHVHNLGPMRAW